ncbi:MAG: hypothetical protein EOP56_01965 [Sphingobacteriales bacterium]|nr:MAG: hypothetical protein EOP56_01965 [Sphingobacteriales bacterium]
MKTFSFCLLAGLNLVFASCGDNADDNGLVDVTNTDTTSLVPQNLPEQHGYTLAFHGDSLTITSALDSPHKPRRIPIDIRVAGTLTGEVITERPANIRVNRVIDAHKGSDGPFGKRFSFEVGEPGIDTIEIGSSLMAENPYSGAFLLKLKLD